MDILKAQCCVTLKIIKTNKFTCKKFRQKIPTKNSTLIYLTPDQESNLNAQCISQTQLFKFIGNANQLT